ncbi:gamma-aminobutyric acid receptor subunit beta-like isoform X3 [Nematostella vectensis]|uniref:gamma-aminobutyric acid receptor subunit beta-like isoform X3 n=1 Tax=Nematostella vectensis TaxID=45351 RepID=UPI00207783ED|nr:gamma-aminobutyric acid receptor subunit beta-like isoform X3 [Nematostella vectensis]
MYLRYKKKTSIENLPQAFKACYLSGTSYHDKLEHHEGQTETSVWAISEYLEFFSWTKLPIPMKQLLLKVFTLWQIYLLTSAQKNETLVYDRIFNDSAADNNNLRPQQQIEATSGYRLKYEEYVIPGRNVSRLLGKVFEKYDKRVRPFYGIKPLQVSLDMLILSFGELREASMEYSVDMYLGQFWQDPRLAFGLDRYIILGGEATDKLWVPDTFFVNSMESKLQSMMFTNKKVWISLMNGTLMLSARLVTRNSCKFDLRNYPLDQQTCHVAFESFSYDNNDLQFSWRKKEVGSEIWVYDRQMAQFDIVSAKRFLKHKIFHSDQFSGLTATIVFQRRSAYYVFQMYIPCVCIVAISWVSFWINHEAVPARVALSITTVLTISYMRGSVNAGMPRVSYLKSIDYFLLGSFVFIFMTLIEYVLVLKYSRREKFKAENKKKCITPDDDAGDSDKKPMLVTVSVGNKSFNFKSSLDDIENGNGIKLHERPKKISLHTRKPLSFRGNRQMSGRKILKSTRLASAFRRSFLPEHGVHWMDKYSRCFFPLGYVAFLAVYFCIYTRSYAQS